MPDTTMSSEQLRLRVLGPFEASAAGRALPIRGSAARVLAVLAVAPGRGMSMAAVGEALWALAPPSGAENAVQSYVSRLRRALEPAGLDAVVATRPPGYVLAVEPDAVDATRFARLVAEGRSALAAGQPAVAVRRLDAALGLWQGEHS